jgi:hypothetical protein
MRKLQASETPRSIAGSMAKRAVCFKIFRGGMVTPWDKLCEEAAAFASTLPPESLINISHSDSHRKGIVTVWYWSV